MRMKSTTARAMTKGRCSEIQLVTGLKSGLASEEVRSKGLPL